MFTTDLHKDLLTLASRYDRDQVAVVCLQHSGVSCQLSEFPTRLLETSEELKSLATVERIWDFLLEKGITRRGLLICIGGGVLTDLGGFAAATYKSGIDYINVPTTLLAMVDASSGGKTGFNYHGLKNAIGAFHAPVETLIYPSLLSTLPAREMLSGFGEMLKTGLLDNGQWTMDNGQYLWNRLLQYDLERMDIAELTPLVEACVRVKEEIVAADPKETGLRKALNLGHTFGHALEEISIQHSDASLQHGYAVVYGLIAELYLSITKLGCPREPLQQMTQLMLHYYGRPQCKCSDREQLIALMRQDKKNERTAEINCTLLKRIGEPVINQVITDDEAHEALDYLFSL